MEKEELSHTWDSFTSRKDSKSKRKLVEHYLLYVNKIATNQAKKLNNKRSQEELASLGLDGLYKAIERYDRSRNVKFETYAYSRIRGAMIDGLRVDDWVPRSVRLRQAMIERECSKQEALEEGRILKTVVLENVGIKEKDYHKNIKKFHATSIASIENTFCVEVGDGNNKKDFNKYLVCKNESLPGDDLLRKEFLNKLMGADFNEVERRMIYHHYYDGITMKAIAASLNISESRMSQIHRNVLKRLKEKIRRNPIYFDENILSLLGSFTGKAGLF